MESKNTGSVPFPDPLAKGPTTPAQQDGDVSFTTGRPRIVPPIAGVPRTDSREADLAEAERLARRYAREAQLAPEGLLYWGMRWPFELLATLVASGRKWEEEYYRPTTKRRVSLYDDETK
jgi:hypothetical protein